MRAKKAEGVEHDFKKQRVWLWTIFIIIIIS